MIQNKNIGRKEEKETTSKPNDKFSTYIRDNPETAKLMLACMVEYMVEFYQKEHDKFMLDYFRIIYPQRKHISFKSILHWFKVKLGGKDV